MGFTRFSSDLIPAVVFFLLIQSPLMCLGNRVYSTSGGDYSYSDVMDEFGYSEAPEYRNGVECSAATAVGTESQCDPGMIHVAMTLDSHYLRGTIAAVHSILRHASCPQQVFLHFIAANSDPAGRHLPHLVRSVFPSLLHRLHFFRDDAVADLISASVRSALDTPLNYARNSLGDMLPPCVKRVIYLDSDVILVHDIAQLWEVEIPPGKTIAAPEYCNANFTSYFTNRFWSDPVLRMAFWSRNPCYFNTGVMVMDLESWREGHYRQRIENWMELQRRHRIYELGSLPPYLLVFAGNLKPIDHRWNQHGLGGDNVEGSCRELHPGAVSLMHWSGKGKPWVRLDEGRPCPYDRLWELYDLYKWTGSKVQQQQYKHGEKDGFPPESGIGFR